MLLLELSVIFNVLLCSHGSQGLGLEPSKYLIRIVRTNIRFCKDHRNSKEHKKMS